MKYKCLILDHDDTSVKSTPEIHYPAFLLILDRLRPDRTCSLDEYIRWNFDPGFFDMCRKIYGFSEDEMKLEHEMWIEYLQTHIPEFYEGIPELIRAQKAAGGYVCVVSHSRKDMILRDYSAANVPAPDIIYGCELPPEHLKPSTYAIEQILLRLNLKKEDVLVIDDLKPGYEMAKRAGVDFAYAAWSSTRLPEIEAFMRENNVPFLDKPF